MLVAKLKLNKKKKNAQKNPKNPIKPNKTQINPKKTRWVVFFKKNRVFANPVALR